MSLRAFTSFTTNYQQNWPPKLKLANPVSICLSRFGSSAERVAPDKTAIQQQALEAGLTPKTHTYDFFMSRSRHQPEHSGVVKMDIIPLEDKTDWFRIDANYPRDLALKQQIQQELGHLTTITLPKGEAGAKELLEVMANYLPEQFPDQFEKTGRVLTNRQTGERFDLDNLPVSPIEVAGRLVQEDLVLLHKDDDGEYRLSAGSLHFPSGWSLQEKLGKTVVEIHEPVPLMNASIGEHIRRFLDRLTPAKQFWRINFLFSTSTELPHLKDVPEEHPYSDVRFRDGVENTPENVNRLVLRSEREIFTKLPQSGDVLFSLKTYFTRFRDLPGVVAQKLSEVLAALPQHFTEEYKGLDAQERQVVLDYLNQQATNRP
jgi:dimethylamine monooxygenase subunit A